MIRDTWRAVLVVVVACALREALAGRQAPMVVHAPPAWQPAWQAPPAPEQPRPLRRVGAAFVELADSVIGVIRR